MSERRPSTPARIPHPLAVQQYHTVPSTPTPGPSTSNPNALFTPQLLSFTPSSDSPSFLLQRCPTCGSTVSNAPDSGATPDRRRRRRMGDEEKLGAILETLAQLRWTVGDFLYHLFRIKTPEGDKVDRGPAHRSTVTAFLSGRSTHKPIEILTAWLDDPSSKAGRDSPEYTLSFSTSKDVHEIKHAYPAITSAAAQMVRDRLVKEMHTVVKASSGLQGTIPGIRGKQLSWEDVGPETVNEVKQIIEEVQPLTWALVIALATPAPKKVGGTVVVRKSRPPELAATELISSLNFCHTRFARRLPVARAILYVACGAQQTLFQYGSRVAHLPSWNTTYSLLRKLAAQSAQALVELAHSPGKAAGIRIDNVQKYLKQREMRMGRMSEMKVGLAATVAEMIAFDPSAFDIADKQARIAEDRRKGLTVQSLLGMLDQTHTDVVSSLQWLQTLVNYIPQLHQYKPGVAELYRTVGAKKLLPRSHQTMIHPMGTINQNEAVTKELRDALNDILGQLGQREDSYVPRLIFIGGDGLTYEKIVQLKRYLQFQSNEFRRLDLLWPFLENWHTGWTRLSLIYETHWGEELTRDPSKIGHSASKIGQKVPGNLKKVDYYPALYLAYLTLDARMLDCWRIELQADDIFEHFASLEQDKKLPTLDDLHKTAQVLHRRYSTRRAYYCALNGFSPDDDRAVPPGKPWDPPPAEATSTGKKAPQPKNKDEKNETRREGDQCLAQSIMFMHDTLMHREVTRSVAEGDVGRLWEGTKAMLFNFAGSTHTKYATYLLEMVADLELESSPAFREAFFMNWLVNPSGEPAGYQEGDLMQEHYNRELESFIARRDGEWDDVHLREVIAPNIHRFLDAKKHWGEGLGLAKRRGKHTSPESKPEIRTLLGVYKDEQLHYFRKGRAYNADVDHVDTFGRGVDRLADGRLQRWIDQTVRARNLARTARSGDENSSIPGDGTAGDTEPLADNPDGFDAFDDLDDGDADEDEDVRHTHGSVSLVDGQVVVQVEGQTDDPEDVNWDDLRVSSSDDSSDEGNAASESDGDNGEGGYNDE